MAYSQNDPAWKMAVMSLLSLMSALGLAITMYWRALGFAPAELECLRIKVAERRK